MSNIVITHRILSPESHPRYIVADELGSLKLVNSDTELIKLESKIQNYKLDSMNLGLSERLENYGHLIFTPVGHCNSIESITLIINTVYWHSRKVQGMSDQSIILQFIRTYITDQI